MHVGFEKTVVMSQRLMEGDRDDSERDHLDQTRPWVGNQANNMYVTKPEGRTRAGLEAQKA